MNEDMITLQLTPEQAAMLKLCLADAKDSSNKVVAKWAGIFLDAIQEGKNG